MYQFHACLTRSRALLHKGTAEDIDVHPLKPGAPDVVEVASRSTSVSFLLCEDHLPTSTTSVPDSLHDNANRKISRNDGTGGSLAPNATIISPSPTPLNPFPSASCKTHEHALSTRLTRIYQQRCLLCHQRYARVRTFNCSTSSPPAAGRYRHFRFLRRTAYHDSYRKFQATSCIGPRQPQGQRRRCRWTPWQQQCRTTCALCTLMISSACAVCCANIFQTFDLVAHQIHLIVSLIPFYIQRIPSFSVFWLHLQPLLVLVGWSWTVLAAHHGTIQLFPTATPTRRLSPSPPAYFTPALDGPSGSTKTLSATRILSIAPRPLRGFGDKRGPP